MEDIINEHKDQLALIAVDLRNEDANDSLKMEKVCASEIIRNYNYEGGTVMNITQNKPKSTVLIVDDVEMNRNLFNKFLKEDYHVLQAENGKEAMGILEEKDVNLVLLDIVMPLMDGYEVIIKMKENPKFQNIPIIVATGSGREVERKVLDLGAEDFVQQPYDSYIIRKRISNIMERYELRTLTSDAKEQKRFRDLFDILGIAYWEWTLNEGYYSSEEYKKYAISEMENDKIWDPEALFAYIHPDDVNLMKEFMQAHSQKEIKKSAVVRCKMKDGSYCWTEMFSIAETTAEGDLLRLVSIMRDVNKEWLDQRARLEEALEDAQSANNAKTAFLSRISHDMRTPLNGILGLTTLLKNSVTDSKINRDLAELELSGQYLLNLINDTLDVSRIESGKLELHPIVCDGRMVFNNALSLAKTNAQTKHIELNVKLDDIPFTLIYVDIARIEQVVMNVIGNAIKFTPEGEVVNISMSNLSVEQGIITDKLIVEDTGAGMSPEFLPHIFEAFSQEDATRTSNTQGTGLGMAITKQLLNRMDGDIFVESELGKGSKFTIIMKFPIATDEQIAEFKKTKIRMNDGVQLHGKRILMCEDHPLNTAIATRLLETKGIIVEHAENGKIGVDMFMHSVSNYYDAVLMDIRMPVMDGIEAAKSIRKLPRRDARVIPIIAMTANAFSDDIQQTKDVGMDAHLSKPIQPEILFETLADLLNVEHNYRKKMILVVDDIKVNRAVMRASLEDDYEIVEAEDGNSAMEILHNMRGIDAVITDIQMPGMDGITLIKEIRKKEKFRHIVIIANTQFGDPEQEEKLLVLGANDFVYKPTTPKIVEIRVRNALTKL